MLQLHTLMLMCFHDDRSFTFPGTSAARVRTFTNHKRGHKKNHRRDWHQVGGKNKQTQIYRTHNLKVSQFTEPYWDITVFCTSEF